MRVERKKNFLSVEECSALNTWVLEAIDKKWMVCGATGAGEYRRTNRQNVLGYEYPQLVLDISDRVRKFCGVSKYGLLDNYGLERSGKNGVIVAATFGGGNLRLHKDRRTVDGFSTLRCNIMTSAPQSGGKLYIEGEWIDIEVGELHCYLASEVLHCVTTVEGNIPRTMWMFGAAVPEEAWNNYTIKFGNQDE